MALKATPGRGLYMSGNEQHLDLLLKVVPDIAASAYKGVYAVIVGDISGSMIWDLTGYEVGDKDPKSRISLLRQALLNLPRYMGEADIASLVCFSGKAYEIFRGKTKRDWPRREIENLRSVMDNTLSWTAFKEAQGILKDAPDGYYKCILFLSDGEDNGVEEAKRYVPSDVPVYTFAIGKKPNAAFYGYIIEKSGSPMPTVAISKATDFSPAFQKAMGVARDVKSEDVTITLNLAAAKDSDQPMLAPSLVYQVAPVTQGVKLTPGNGPTQLKIGVVGGMGSKGVAIYLQGLFSAPSATGDFYNPQSGYERPPEVSIGTWSASWKADQIKREDGGPIVVKLGEGISAVDDDVKTAGRVANASVKMDQARLAASQGNFGKSKAMLAQAKKVTGSGGEDFKSVDELIDKMMEEAEQGNLSAATFGASKAMTAKTAQDLLEE